LCVALSSKKLRRAAREALILVTNGFHSNKNRNKTHATSVVVAKLRSAAAKFASIPEMNMRVPIKTLAAAVVVAAIPLAAPATAAPLSHSLALSHAEAGSLEQVQYRRWHRRHYRSGWYAYGAGRGYIARSGPRRWNYGNGSAATAPGSWRGCPGGDRVASTSYPSWMCR
jgi:hypothetical protein